MYMAVKGMSCSQKEMVRQMGFGAFLDIKLDSIPSRLAYYLVDKFRAKHSTIKTKKGEILITKKTVEKMFGLPSEGLDYNQLVECNKTNIVIEAWKSQCPGGKFNNGNYVKRIRQSDVADDMFKLNFLTLFINTFAETEMSEASRINCLEKLARSGHAVTLLLTYEDKVVLNGYNLRRSRPLIKHIDSVDLDMLEEHGFRNGKFGTLEFRADGEVDPIDVNGDEDNVGLEEDANDDVVKEWSRKVQKHFNVKNVEHVDNISPTNEATMKMPIKVAVNSGQSNFVKGSGFVKGNSPICNVQSTGRNNKKTKIVDGCDSSSMLFLEYKGNTSLDSLVVLTPGFLNMSDEIVEQSMRKNKDVSKMTYHHSCHTPKPRMAETSGGG
ncbi:unnamed protein product [Lactuca saligna]|uniref:Uncharacterized protein n=1 Tax=Lactuca saligna TaxID=75948 RepID=A0AA35ZW08_LACSI|nr:unnamed protein product [Lactuca saligna]